MTSLTQLVILTLHTLVSSFTINSTGKLSVSHAPHSHTRQPRYVITDQHHREILLRGVNINLQGWRRPGNDRPMNPTKYTPGNKCPTYDNSKWMNPPLCEVEAGQGKYNQSTLPNSHNDLAQIRSLGMNFVRLGISWSLIEPQPGQYSTEYINRIAQVVSWAKEQDIYVLLDFHQDWYSYSLNNGSRIGSYVDGAPSWAVLNSSINKMSTIEKDVWEKVGFDWHTVAAFRTFYNNQIPKTSSNNLAVGTAMGIQEHYIRMVAAIVKRFVNESTVVGYEIMNEPPPSQLNVLDFSNKILYPFYKRVIQAVTGVRDHLKDCPLNDTIRDDCAFPDLNIHSHQLMFVEPCAIRNQLDRSIQNVWNFTSYNNIVYAPHSYTNSFTLSKNVPYEQALDTAWKEAYKMRASVIVTEFGSGTSQLNLNKLGNITQEQDKHLTGSTFWVWKEGSGGWSMWIGAEDTKGMKLQPRRESILVRARPYAVLGQLLALNYNVTLQRLSFTASFNDSLVNQAAFPFPPTLVYVPTLMYLEGRNVTISVTGAARLGSVVVQPDGSREVEIACTGKGRYSVEIG